MLNYTIFSINSDIELGTVRAKSPLEAMRIFSHHCFSSSQKGFGWYALDLDINNVRIDVEKYNKGVLQC